jgi:phospholipid transport system substrate-binding protein
MKLKLLLGKLMATALLLPASQALVADHAVSAATADPEVVLEHTARHILAQVNTRRDEFTENLAALQDVVRVDLMPMLDIQYTARLVLAKEGRKATPEQIEAFTTAMSELLIQRYSEGLLRFRHDEQFEVMPVRGELNPRMTRVRSRILLESGGFAPVDYAFRKTSEGWKAFDVIVEGISYVTTFRNQIVPQVQAEGLDAVILKLSSGNIELGD